MSLSLLAGEGVRGDVAMSGRPITGIWEWDWSMDWERVRWSVERIWWWAGSAGEVKSDSDFSWRVFWLDVRSSQSDCPAAEALIWERAGFE